MSDQFTKLKKDLSKMKLDKAFINVEYMMDQYGKDAICYNYLMGAAYWKISKHNQEILKENYG